MASQFISVFFLSTFCLSFTSGLNNTTVETTTVLQTSTLPETTTLSANTTEQLPNTTYHQSSTISKTTTTSAATTTFFTTTNKQATTSTSKVHTLAPTPNCNSFTYLSTPQPFDVCLNSKKGTTLTSKMFRYRLNNLYVYEYNKPDCEGQETIREISSQDVQTSFKSTNYNCRYVKYRAYIPSTRPNATQHEVTSCPAPKDVDSLDYSDFALVVDVCLPHNHYIFSCEAPPKNLSLTVKHVDGCGVTPENVTSHVKTASFLCVEKTPIQVRSCGPIPAKSTLPGKKCNVVMKPDTPSSLPLSLPKYVPFGVCFHVWEPVSFVFQYNGDTGKLSLILYKSSTCDGEVMKRFDGMTTTKALLYSYDPKMQNCPYSVLRMFDAGRNRTVNDKPMSESSGCVNSANATKRWSDWPFVAECYAESTGKNLSFRFRCDKNKQGKYVGVLESFTGSRKCDPKYRKFLKFDETVCTVLPGWSAPNKLTSMRIMHCAENGIPDLRTTIKPSGGEKSKMSTGVIVVIILILVTLLGLVIFMLCRYYIMGKKTDKEYQHLLKHDQELNPEDVAVDPEDAAVDPEDANVEVNQVNKANPDADVEVNESGYEELKASEPEPEPEDGSPTKA